MQIEVSVDEADISRIKLGQQATFSVDAYPEQKFVGKVVQIRSAPVVNQNVVTYVVVVNVDNDEMKLMPGMTANVSIVVAKKDDVVKIPPAALRFKPKGGEEKPAAGKGKPDATGASMGKGSREGGKKPGDKKESGQIVYTLKDGKPMPVFIKTGIAGSGSVELLEGALKDGDEVIVEQTGGDAKKKGSSSPMGRPF
jgi:HlyD family secretion protein